MSVLVVGTTALDSIKTPTKENPRLLGGSASHAAVAASFFSPVNLVGGVGEDFPAKYVQLYRKHGIDLAGLRQVVGDEVALVDSAEAMAEQVAAVLAEKHLANPSHAQPRYDFYVTDVPLRFQTIGERFLGRTLNNVHVVKW